MGYDVKAWLSKKIFGEPTPASQKGVTSYVKPKKDTTDVLDKAGDIGPAPRRGDTDKDYDTYAEDRKMDKED